VCIFYYHAHTRLSGASGARHSLRPQFGEGGKFRQNSGRMRRRDREAMSQRIASAAMQSIAQAHQGSKKEWIASLRSQ
jgi:hypothetical protein